MELHIGTWNPPIAATLIGLFLENGSLFRGGSLFTQTWLWFGISFFFSVCHYYSSLREIEPYVLMNHSFCTVPRSIVRQARQVMNSFPVSSCASAPFYVPLHRHYIKWLYLISYLQVTVVPVIWRITSYDRCCKCLGYGRPFGTCIAYDLKSVEKPSANKNAILVFAF